MLAKFGFILILLLFGALTFLAGVLAPPGLRQPVEGLAQQAVLHLPGAHGQSATSSHGAAPSSAAAASASASASAAEPLPAESLLIPAPLPAKAQFALQAAQFASADEAAALTAHIQQLKLPFQKTLSVQDQNGRKWVVVPIGPYASEDDAQTANATVPGALGLNGPLPIILLPPA